MNGAHSDDPKVIWNFIRRYAPDASPEKSLLLDRLVKYAIQYYRDFVLPEKNTANRMPANTPHSPPSPPPLKRWIRACPPRIT